MNTIYADYQATAPVDPRVFDAMTPFWKTKYGNPHSSDHIVGWKAAEAVNNSASAVANMIGGDPDEVIFTSGATEANNMALFGLARRAPHTRNRLLVSAIEHKCVLAVAQTLAEREGFAVETIPVDGEGFIDLDFLESRLDESVGVVSVMAVNNEVGTIQDIPAIAALTERYGVAFHCDAAQSPCAMDVSDLVKYAGLISLSGHKIYGPQGIGALYVRRDMQSRIEPLIYGGGQQYGLRSGTVPLPLCVGLGVAAEIMSSPEQRTELERVADQRDCFIRGLVNDSSFSIIVNGPRGKRRHPGNANLRFGGFNAQDILSSIQPWLAASTGAACTTGIPEPSHVLISLGLTALEADSSIRFSFGRFTQDYEVERAALLVQSTLDRLKFVSKSMAEE